MATPCAKDIVASISHIGSLPQTLAAVLKVINNPNSGADEIANVISRDISLTSLVLRMVNSISAGRRRKVTKISEAVVVMGLNSIKVMTLSSSVFGLVSDKQLLQKCNIKRVWRHMIETAANARSIATSIKYREPEEAFVAGILHDMGIVLMMLHYREKYLELIQKMKDDHKGILNTEKEIFGLTHTEVGAEMAIDWKLPPSLAHVAMNHHSIDAGIIIPDDAILNDIIALADRLSTEPFDEYYPDLEENIIFIQSAGKRLGLDSIEINRIRKESVMESIRLAEYLELDIGDVLEILTEANNKLAGLYFSLEKIYLEKQKLQEMINEAPQNEAVASA
jgi:putative nucleotidyltransferase with HDIG domain